MKKNYNNHITSVDILLGTILLVIPLIVRLKVVKLTGTITKIWPTGNYNYDIFSYYKSRLLIVLTILSIIFFILNLYKKKINLVIVKFTYINLFLFSIFLLISHILSSEKFISLWGAPDRFEGLLVWLCYLLLVFIGINIYYTNSEKKVVFLLKFLNYNFLIISLIALMQYFNHDIFQSTFGKKLIVPQKYWGSLDTITFALGERAAYGTLYNTNYVGSYIALLFPIFLVCALMLIDNFDRFKYLIFVLIALAVLFASHSRAGLVGVIISFLFMMTILNRRLLKQKKLIIIAGILIVAVLSGINYVSKGYIFNKFATLFTDVRLLFSNEKQIINDNLPLSISTNDKKLKFVYTDDIIEFDLNSNLKIYDKNKNLINYEYDKTNGRITLGGKYSNKQFVYGMYNNMDMIILEDNGIQIKFVLKGDKFKIFNSDDITYEISEIESIGFKGKEHLGSARGYIWSRTLPLIKKHPLFGTGVDTFMMFFPQNDVLGKARYNYDPYILVDKPHNMYLAIAQQMGLITLIVFLILIFGYIIESVKVYKNANFYKEVEVYGFGIFLGIVGYLVAAFFNDSIVSVSPIFWVLLGVGFGLNKAIIIQNKK
ncbi:MAG: O-antigen ligase family protein [Caloramator sp.]|nr:O-antigen ligase family protein [Caloramator sp.]